MSISWAIYNGHWLDIDPSVRKALLMVMLRSSKPLFLTGKGYFRVSLESCAKVRKVRDNF